MNPQAQNSPRAPLFAAPPPSQLYSTPFSTASGLLGNAGWSAHSTQPHNVPHHGSVQQHARYRPPGAPYSTYASAMVGTGMAPAKMHRSQQQQQQQSHHYHHRHRDLLSYSLATASRIRATDGNANAPPQSPVSMVASRGQRKYSNSMFGAAMDTTVTSSSSSSSDAAATLPVDEKWFAVLIVDGQSDRRPIIKKTRNPRKLLQGYNNGTPSVPHTSDFMVGIDSPKKPPTERVTGSTTAPMFLDTASMSTQSAAENGGSMGTAALIGGRGGAVTPHTTSGDAMSYMFSFQSSAFIPPASHAEPSAQQQAESQRGRQQPMDDEDSPMHPVTSTKSRRRRRRRGGGSGGAHSSTSSSSTSTTATRRRPTTTSHTSAGEPSATAEVSGAAAAVATTIAAAPADTTVYPLRCSKCMGVRQTQTQEQTAVIQRRPSPEWNRGRYRIGQIHGEFRCEGDVDRYIEIWTNGSRGTISKAARGEVLSAHFSYNTFGDLGVLLLDDEVYKCIECSC